MNVYAVIMAGGVGSRFWPRSKEKTPKQLLQIFGKDSMIQATVNRLNGLVKNENILIITNKTQKEEIVKQLPQIPVKNIIEEPFGRNTAACIGLASVLIEQLDNEAVTITLPADHIIKEKDEFHNTLTRAINYAYKSKGLVTIGIEPTRPETGYGYIQVNDSEVEDSISKVKTFAEKPNYATALRFLESGDFLWNSGMFIWSVDSILNEIRKYMPDLYEGLQILKKKVNENDFDETLVSVYGQLRNISIDYGIMEKSSNVYLTRGRFTWSDVGSWEEVYQLSEKDKEGNAITGNVLSEMVVDSYIYSPEKFTAVIGVENLIIINTEKELLVCRRDKAQDVKKVVDYLKMNNYKNHL